MKVVILHGSNDNYGASRALVSETTGLLADGHRVSVYMPIEGPLSAALSSIGAEVHIQPKMIVLRKSRLRDALHAPVIDPAWAKNDVVVLWTLALAGYLPLLRRAKVPHIISVHEIVGAAVERAVSRFVIGRKSQVIANSDATRSALIDAGVPARMISVLFPSIDTRNVVIPDTRAADRRCVAVLARVNGTKGHLEVAKGLKILHGQDPRWRGYFYGAPFPGQEAALEEVLKEIDGCDFLSYRGEVGSIGEIDPRIGTVAAFPSRLESFGLVPIEAALRGILTVGYADGGATQALSLAGGLLCERTVRHMDDIVAGLSSAVANSSEFGMNDRRLLELQRAMCPNVRSEKINHIFRAATMVYGE